MPLVICPGCSQRISGEAPSCPQCGMSLGASRAADPAAGEVRQDIRRGWRFQAGNAIGIVGVFLGIFVMMASLPLGLLIIAASAVIGWRLAS